MRRLVLAAAAAIVATSAFAGPVEDRIATMKGVAAATKEAAGFAKGDTPFDAAKIKTLMQVYIDAAGKMPTLYPEDTKTAADSSAGPKVWEDAAGFKAEFEKFAADATAAAATTDTATFGAAFGKVTGHCKTCHETFRIKKG